MDTAVSLKGVEKYYGNKGNIVKALDGISFDMERGEFLAIMGASGSGKSTLLNVISTIDTVSAGHIVIGGKDITELTKKEVARFRREQLGFIFQDYNLLDTLTIEENIALALIINGRRPDEVDRLVKQTARQLDIERILNNFPYETSGGQKQRAACARAIITGPGLILADEPTGALDSKSAQMFMETLLHLNDTVHSTILMVTHDPFAASYCRRVLFIKDGKIFTELRKGDLSRKALFEKILDVVALLGGGEGDVR